MTHFAPLLALAGPPSEGESPLASFVLMGIIFGIFYFVLILPMRQKQKKLDELVARLKPGDKIILNAGIFGTVEGVEPEGLLVRIADKTKIKVLRSAVAGLQAAPEPESK